ncbi:hypothetical protein BESB_028340 [Besnoitia besnoiti]|uniref:Uncharacterized protein n=1 Tax=Besnoitia besnoiti TaxID=94643 RepID=A0A2A9M0C3_BESBE|nr:uncharacterized protein BESB_028340 [Besnoitia besnoiti]PFH31399.1 hypothetical protein BESB_028340 [Besnoitia besnoiti]
MPRLRLSVAPAPRPASPSTPHQAAAADQPAQASSLRDGEPGLHQRDTLPRRGGAGKTSASASAAADAPKQLSPVLGGVSSSSARPAAACASSAALAEAKEKEAKEADEAPSPQVGEQAHAEKPLAGFPQAAADREGLGLPPLTGDPLLASSCETGGHSASPSRFYHMHACTCPSLACAAYGLPRPPSTGGSSDVFPQPVGLPASLAFCGPHVSLGSSLHSSQSHEVASALRYLQGGWLAELRERRCRCRSRRRPSSADSTSSACLRGAHVSRKAWALRAWREAESELLSSRSEDASSCSETPSCWRGRRRRQRQTAATQERRGQARDCDCRACRRRRRGRRYRATSRSVHTQSSVSARGGRGLPAACAAYEATIASKPRVRGRLQQKRARPPLPFVKLRQRRGNTHSSSEEEDLRGERDASPACLRRERSLVAALASFPHFSHLGSEERRRDAIFKAPALRRARASDAGSESSATQHIPWAGIVTKEACKATISAMNHSRGGGSDVRAPSLSPSGLLPEPSAEGGAKQETGASSEAAISRVAQDASAGDASGSAAAARRTLEAAETGGSSAERRALEAPAADRAPSSCDREASSLGETVCHASSVSAVEDACAALAQQPVVSVVPRVLSCSLSGGNSGGSSWMSQWAGTPGSLSDDSASDATSSSLFSFVTAVAGLGPVLRLPSVPPRLASATASSRSCPPPPAGLQAPALALAVAPPLRQAPKAAEALKAALAPRLLSACEDGGGDCADACCGSQARAPRGRAPRQLLYSARVLGDNGRQGKGTPSVSAHVLKDARELWSPSVDTPCVAALLLSASAKGSDDKLGGARCFLAASIEEDPQRGQGTPAERRSGAGAGLRVAKGEGDAYAVAPLGERRQPSGEGGKGEGRFGRLRLLPKIIYDPANEDIGTSCGSSQRSSSLRSSPTASACDAAAPRCLLGLQRHPGKTGSARSASSPKQLSGAVRPHCENAQSPRKTQEGRKESWGVSGDAGLAPAERRERQPVKAPLEPLLDSMNRTGDAGEETEGDAGEQVADGIVVLAESTDRTEAEGLRAQETFRAHFALSVSSLALDRDSESESNLDLSHDRRPLPPPGFGIAGAGRETTGAQANAVAGSALKNPGGRDAPVAHAGRNEGLRTGQAERTERGETRLARVRPSRRAGGNSDATTVVPPAGEGLEGLTTDSSSGEHTETSPSCSEDWAEAARAAEHGDVDPVADATSGEPTTDQLGAEAARRRLLPGHPGEELSPTLGPRAASTQQTTPAKTPTPSASLVQDVRRRCQPEARMSFALHSEILSSDAESEKEAPASWRLGRETPLACSFDRGLPASWAPKPASASSASAGAFDFPSFGGCRSASLAAHASADEKAAALPSLLHPRPGCGVAKATDDALQRHSERRDEKREACCRRSCSLDSTATEKPLEPPRQNSLACGVVSVATRPQPTSDTRTLFPFVPASAASSASTGALSVPLVQGGTGSSALFFSFSDSGGLTGLEPPSGAAAAAAGTAAGATASVRRAAAGAAITREEKREGEGNSTSPACSSVEDEPRPPAPPEPAVPPEALPTRCSWLSFSDCGSHEGASRPAGEAAGRGSLLPGLGSHDAETSLFRSEKNAPSARDPAMSCAFAGLSASLPPTASSQSDPCAAPSPLHIPLPPLFSSFSASPETLHLGPFASLSSSGAEAWGPRLRRSAGEDSQALFGAGDRGSSEPPSLAFSFSASPAPAASIPPLATVSSHASQSPHPCATARRVSAGAAAAAGKLLAPGFEQPGSGPSSFDGKQRERAPDRGEGAASSASCPCSGCGASTAPGSRMRSSLLLASSEGEEAFGDVLSTQELPSMKLKTRWGLVEVTDAGDFCFAFKARSELKGMYGDAASSVGTEETRETAESEPRGKKADSVELLFVAEAGGRSVKIQELGDEAPGRVLKRYHIECLPERQALRYRYASEVVACLKQNTAKVTLKKSGIGLFQLMSNTPADFVATFTSAFSLFIASIHIRRGMVAFQSRVGNVLHLPVDDVALLLTQNPAQTGSLASTSSSAEDRRRAQTQSCGASSFAGSEGSRRHGRGSVATRSTADSSTADSSTADSSTADSSTADSSCAGVGGGGCSGESVSARGARAGGKTRGAGVGAEVASAAEAEGAEGLRGEQAVAIAGSDLGGEFSFGPCAEWSRASRESRAAPGEESKADAWSERERKRQWQEVRAALSAAQLPLASVVQAWQVLLRALAVCCEGERRGLSAYAEKLKLRLRLAHRPDADAGLFGGGRPGVAAQGEKGSARFGAASDSQEDIEQIRREVYQSVFPITVKRKTHW